MSGKRGDRVAPPPRPGGYTLRFATNDAIKGWEDLSQQAPNNLRAAYGAIEVNPTAVSERQHQLKGRLATDTYKGKLLDQWQYEVTGAGRIWYLIDPDTHTCWIKHAGTGHPKATD